MALFARGVPSLSSSLEKNTALLTSVRRRRRKASRHGCEAPLLHIRFDENKSHLSKVHVDCTGSIGAHCRKEILCFESMGDIVQLLTVASEEDCSASRSVSDTNDIALYILGAVEGWGERLIKTAVTRGYIGNGRLVVS